MMKSSILKAVLCAVCIGVTTPTLSQSTRDQQAQAQYFLAEGAFYNQRYGEALRELAKAERLLGGTNPVLSSLKVKILAGQGSFAAAKKELIRFFRLNPGAAVADEMSGFKAIIENGINKQEAARLAASQRQEAARLAEIKRKDDARLAAIKYQRDLPTIIIPRAERDIQELKDQIRVLKTKFIRSEICSRRKSDCRRDKQSASKGINQARNKLKTKENELDTMWAQLPNNTADKNARRKARNEEPLRDQYEWGQLYDQVEHYSKAIEWYLLAANKGYASAQISLGEIYAYGKYPDNPRFKTVMPNEKESLRWYRMAASQGDARGQHRLGNMYRFGIGVTRNEDETFRLYHLSANQGYVHGQESLALSYYVGFGVARNAAMAAKWYQKAAAQGSAFSQVKLAELYWVGFGVEENKKEAIRLYQQAARQGDFEAEQKLRELGESY